MSAQVEEIAPDTAPETPTKPASKKKRAVSKAKPASAERKKKTKKGKGPGKYSQLVIDAIRTLGERNGSSLFKIYNEAKKVSWFDQQHGRVYLRYSIRALLQNDTLVQVKGLGANGSFKLNKKKFISKSDTKKSSVKPKKTTKTPRKPATKTAEKKKRASGVKKKAKKTSKPKKADKSPPAVAAKTKAKKSKKTKKTVKKA